MSLVDLVIAPGLESFAYADQVIFFDGLYLRHRAEGQQRPISQWSTEPCPTSWDHVSLGGESVAG